MFGYTSKSHRLADLVRITRGPVTLGDGASLTLGNSVGSKRPIGGGGF